MVPYGYDTLLYSNLAVMFLWIRIIKGKKQYMDFGAKMKMDYLHIGTTEKEIERK